MRAVVIEEFGGLDVLEVREDHPDPTPGADQVLIRVELSGLNFADTHQRQNTYVQKYETPRILGSEVAGEVVVGAGEFSPGDRVIALVPSGGYAELAVAPVETVYRLPEGADAGEALALVIQGLTAWHLYATQGRVQPGETVVIHAAAGGVGSLAVQLAKQFQPGRVIATASTEAKRDFALSLGADVALDYDLDDLNGALRDANGGEQVDVVFEMAGGKVFDESLKALAPLGRLVVCGIASHQPNEVSSGRLMQRSQSIVGFWLMHCLGRRDMVEEPLAALLGLVASGDLSPVVGNVYPLSDVRRAHEDLQGRKTTGKLLLDPTS